MSYRTPILVVSFCLILFFGAWIIVTIIEFDHEADGNVVLSTQPKITIIESSIPQNTHEIDQLKAEITSLKKTVEEKPKDQDYQYDRYNQRPYMRYYNDYYDNYDYYDNHYYDYNDYDRRYNDDEWDLTVYVEDEDGNDIEDARVRVEDGDHKTKYTDNDGRARFYDLEDDCYDIEVDADGYDDYDDDFCLHRDRSITVEMRD